MSFIRPDALATLLRWREALVGVAVCAVSLWFILTDYGLRRWLGYAGFALGLALIWEGVTRARFPADGGGAGVVEVDERQITYFGPDGGSSLSLDELARVTIRTTNLGPFAPDLFWEFTSDGHHTLTIPGDAEGVEALFDALTALPGADYEAVTRAAGSTDNATFTVWERPIRRLH